MLALTTAALAFAGPALRSPARASVSMVAVKDMVGVSAPLGFFDPLGFSKDPEKVNYLRESELKHGRSAMFAVLGWVTTAAGFHPLLDSLKIAPGATPLVDMANMPLTSWKLMAVRAHAALRPRQAALPAARRRRVGGATPGAHGARLLRPRALSAATAAPAQAFITAVEIFSLILAKDPKYKPGDLLGAGEYMDPTDEGWNRYQLAELNNGRLAMLGFAGLFAESVIFGHPFAGLGL